MVAHGRRFRKSSQGDADQVDGAVDITLTQLMTRAHDAVRVGLGRPPRHREHDDHTVDHDTDETYDAEVATVSGHLGVVEAVVHPVARRRLPGGGASVSAQRRRARRIERVMRLLEGRVHGDSHAAGADVDALQQELGERLERYAAIELELATGLDGVLTPTQRRSLVTRFTAASRHAPTRPHPYTPHPRGLARVMLRIDAVWDRAMDTMDNRVVPGQARKRRTRPTSLWDRYFLAPQFDDSPEAAPTDSRSV